MSATRATETQAAGFPPEDSTAPPPPLSWAIPRKKWLLPAVAVGCVALLGAGVRALLSDSTKANSALVFYTVKRGSLPIVVVERGNLESQFTEQVICEVENFGGERYGQSGTQILFIVPNGSSVKKGDLLVELDSAPLKERLDTQFLAMERAEAEKTQAEIRYTNQETQNTTALAEAELRVKLAQLDVESYEDEKGGTFQIEMQNLDMEIQNARAQQLIRKKDCEAVQALYDLGYKTEGDLATAKLSLSRSNSELASNIARKRQLEEYTYSMQKLDRQGKLDTASRNLDQVKLNNQAELAQAETARDSARRAYDKEKERYDRYNEQLEKCKIFAPQDGMVAYAVSDSRRGGAVIEAGAFVRERQEILTLPNLTKMQVNTAVHESVLDQVAVELKAVIRVDAFPDRSFTGRVKSVAVLPDQGGWFASDTKVYKTIVTIDEDVQQLKPGMTAVVEIDVERVDNVLSVPIQAVVQRGSGTWCFVRAGSGVARKEITLGKTNDKFVEVKAGLAEGDSVVLNPMSLLDEEEEAKKEEEEGEEGKADAKSGEAKSGGADAAPGKSGREGAGPDADRGNGAGRGMGPGPGSGAGGDAGAPGQRGGAGVMPGGEKSFPGGGDKSRRGGGPGSFIRMFDKDGDGKISKEEAPEPMRAGFDKLDKNGDGLLEQSEMGAMPDMRRKSEGAPGEAKGKASGS